jgi:hypothetical protein
LVDNLPWLSPCSVVEIHSFLWGPTWFGPAPLLGARHHCYLLPDVGNLLHKAFRIVVTLVATTVSQWHAAIVSCCYTVATGLFQLTTFAWPTSVVWQLTPHTLMHCDMHGYAHIVFFHLLGETCVRQAGLSCCTDCAAAIPVVDSIVAAAETALCCGSSWFAVCSPLL